MRKIQVFDIQAKTAKGNHIDLTVNIITGKDNPIMSFQTRDFFTHVKIFKKEEKIPYGQLFYETELTRDEVKEQIEMIKKHPELYKNS